MILYNQNIWGNTDKPIGNRHILIKEMIDEIRPDVVTLHRFFTVQKHWSLWKEDSFPLRVKTSAPPSLPPGRFSRRKRPVRDLA